MDLPPLLGELLRADGPSGYESPASEIWRRAASFAELSGDRVGSSIARHGTEAPLLAVVGHIDEIGFIIRHIDEDGFLWFAPIGYWEPETVVGQRVRIRTASESVLGVIGRRPASLGFISGPSETKKIVELSELHIDIGASNREEAAERVRVGDSVVIAAEPVQVSAERIVSKALDDRVGAYIALESLRRCAEKGESTVSFAAVASVQEEPGMRGAQPVTFGLRPDIAIAVDVYHSSDAPDMPERELGEHLLGSGPIIGRGPTLSPVISELLIQSAEEEGINFTLGGYGQDGLGTSTGTDADLMQLSRSGVATGVVSIPLRYLHTPVEMIDLRDVESAVQLICAFSARLTPDLDLNL